MIEQKKDDFSEVVQELEIVLNNIKDTSNRLRLKRAIERLKNNALTVQIGNKQITFLSNDVVGFKSYDDYAVPITVLKEEEKLNDEVRYVDTKTVAEYYGVTPETVRNWIKQKIISGRQIGGPRGKYIIPKEEFEYLKLRREQDDTEDVMKELLGDEYSDDWEVGIEE